MHKMCIFFQYRYGLESIIYVHVGIPRSTLIVGSWAEFCLARQSDPESNFAAAAMMRTTYRSLGAIKERGD